MGDLIRIDNKASVESREIGILEYRGKPVVTLQMVDELHGRKEGHSGSIFRQQKKRFEETEDFFEIPFSEWNQILNRSETTSQEIQQNQSHGGYRGDMIFLTESGYSLLVKVFDDDLSWKVQKQIVRGYFRYRDALVENRNELMSLALRTQSGIQRLLEKHDNDITDLRGEIKNGINGLVIKQEDDKKEILAELAKLRREFEEALKRRLEPTIRTIRTIIEVLIRCFCGKCPMCNSSMIINDKGEPVVEDKDDGEAPFYQNEHRRGSHNRNLPDMWAVCNKCNWKMYIGEISLADAEHAFQYFHLRRRQLEEDKPKQITIFGSSENCYYKKGKKKKVA